MLQDFRIRHCNCLEHVLCNIVLNEYPDEALLFVDSWKFRYMKNNSYLRDKFSVYLNDYSDLYNTAFEFYGVKIINNVEIERQTEIIEFLKIYKYVALKIKACECPWLSFLHEIHGNHMILVMDYDEKGVFCSDNSAERYFLPYDFVFEYVKQLVIFTVEPRIHNKVLMQKKIVSNLSAKVNNLIEFEDIKLFANEFNFISTVDDELETCELITSPLVKRLSLMGFSRINYCKAIKYIYNDEGPVLTSLEDIFAAMDAVSQKWLLINKNLSKYGVSNDATLLLQINSILLDIADAEYSIACDLLAALLKH